MADGNVTDNEGFTELKAVSLQRSKSANGYHRKIFFFPRQNFFFFTKEIDGFICAFSTSSVLNREPSSFSSTNAQAMSHRGTQRSIFQLHFIVCLPEHKYFPEIFNPRRKYSTPLN
jgi:hypothetical protein